MNISGIEMRATLTKGGLSFKNSKQAIETLVHHLGEDVQVRVTVEPWEDRRSNAANRYYFGAIVTALAKATGHTKLEVHRYIKERLLAEPFYITDPDTGEILDECTVVPETRTMNKKRFTEFVQMAEPFAIEWGAQIDPDERRIYVEALAAESEESKES